MPLPIPARKGVDDGDKHLHDGKMPTGIHFYTE